MQTTTTNELLSLDGISKSFFGVRVLHKVSFTLARGGALGLVGENGAGKSTLMNILGGNLRADAGRMELDGAEYAPVTSQDAARHGIAFIHQELNLFPNLSIAENLFLTRLPRTRIAPLIDRSEMNQRTAELLREVGLQLSPDSMVEDLSAGERQLVEIAKALSIDAALIIFDEPTTSLSVRESERLFALIARLRTRGIAVIYISHTLAEIFRLCDEIVVLRDGEVVAGGAAGTFTIEKLVSLMVGRTLTQIFPERAARLEKEPIGEPDVLLQVTGLSRSGVVENVSFTLHRGEVLGLSGLMGAGRSELVRILFGLDQRTFGEVRLNGEVLQRLSPRELISRGVAFLTENRRTEGLCLDGNVAENLSLASLSRHVRGPFRWLMRDALNSAVKRVREVVRLDAKARDSQLVRTLSGGNQQKVVLGKWLLREPRLLILDEPTRGIDVGAKFEIYRLVRKLADGGAGLLVISSEIEELMGLCERILVIRRGKLVDELPRAEFDRERILRAALGEESRM